MALSEQTIRKCAGTGLRVRFTFNDNLCVGTVNGVDGPDVVFEGTINGILTQSCYHMPMDKISDFPEHPTIDIFSVERVGDLTHISPDVLGSITRVTLWLRGTGTRTRTHERDLPFAGVGDIVVDNPVFVPASGCLLSSSSRPRSFAPSTRVLSVETARVWSCPECHTTNSHSLCACRCGGVKPHTKRVLVSSV